MGTDYSTSLVIGFTVFPRDFLKKLEKKRKEVSTTTKRWDPATGKRLPDEKIVDHLGRIDFVINGETFKGYENGCFQIQDEDRLIEAIECLAGCIVYEYGNHVAEEPIWAIEVGRNTKKVDMGEEGIPLKEIPAMMKRLLKARDILLKHKFTFDDKEPRAIAVLNAC